MSKLQETFSSRLGLILATLGMAVGTGNIWRFPRILAKSGGGAFLIAWLLFLFFWSVPLLIAEFGIGRRARQGCIGAANHMGGKKFTWLGTFIAFCTSAILCYYAVVASWCVKYVINSAIFSQPQSGHAAQTSFTHFANSFEPILYSFFALTITGIIVLKGVVKGIERANKIIIPSLFFLLMLAVFKSLSLDGAKEGLSFIFSFNSADFLNVNIWLEALTQSAWSTGAGWGLVLTYGVYVSKNEKIVSTAAITGLGNNIASIIAAIAIIPAVFALAPLSIDSNTLAEMGGVQGLLKEGGPASTGLTFIWLPALFAKMPGGTIFTILFFIALFFAALSSLISMVELGVRTLIDMDINRKKAVVVITSGVFLLGIPSAINLTFFQNQDWVWALGLMMSGLFVSILVTRFGTKRFIKECLAKNELSIFEKLFGFWIKFGIPTLFVIVLGWWFIQSYSWNKENSLNPFEPFSIGTVLFQWIVVITIFIAANSWIVKKVSSKK